VLKGIQHVDDARKAVEAGVDGITVSNHGGRQLDGAIGSPEVLPEIVDAVRNDITIPFDSGVRTGADVINALCLGTKGVYRTAVGLWAGNSGEIGCEGGVAVDY
jgi:lactate 2-monooxygenase